MPRGNLHRSRDEHCVYDRFNEAAGNAQRKHAKDPVQSLADTAALQ